MTGGDLVRDALREIRVLGAAEEPSAEDMTLGLSRLNGIIDRWNARREAVYAEALSSLTLTPALSPHTLGASGGTYTVASRPVSVLACNLVQSDVRTPLHVHHGFEWWASLTDPALSGTPTDLCYVPGWPLGSLYFWPVPYAALGIELYTRILLTAFDAATDVTLPPGYQEALMLTLAEALTPSFGEAAQLSTLTIRAGARARAEIERNNLSTDRTVITTADGLGSCGRGDIRTGRAVR